MLSNVQNKDQTCSFNITSRLKDIDNQKLIGESTPNKQNSTLGRSPRKRQSQSIFTSRIISALKIKNMARRFIRRANMFTGQAYHYLDHRQQHILSTVLDEKFGKQNVQSGLKFNVLEVDSLLTIIWDVLFLVINCCTLVWLPLQLSFGLQDQITQQYLEYGILTSQFLDSLFYLNRVQVKEGRIISDRLQIISIYLDHQLSLDLSQIICMMVGRFSIQRPVQIAAYAMLLSIRSLRVPKLFDKFVEYFNISNQAQDLLTLVNMFMFVSYVVHLIACLWHGVGSFDLDEVTWLKHYGFQDYSTVERYCISFYWAAMTVTTVGYGDITPKNIYEYLCANITMIVVCIVFAFTLNSIGNLIGNIQQREKEFKKNYIILNRYMKSNKVSTELQFKVRSYMEYMRISKMKKDEHKAEKIIKKLSPSLQTELKRSVFLYLMRKIDIFNTFSQRIHQITSEVAETVEYLPEQYIETTEDPNDINLMILQQGKVKEVISSPQAEQISHLQQNGQVIGYLNFFTQTPNTSKYQCLDFTTLVKLPLKSFLKKLQQEKLDREKFCQIKDQLIFGEKQNFFPQKCLVCEGRDHKTTDCSLFRLKIDKERTLKKHLKPSIQNRQTHIRRNLTFQSLKDLQQIQKWQFQFESMLVENGSHYSVIERFEDNIDFDQWDLKHSQLFIPRQIIPLFKDETTRYEDEIPEKQRTTEIMPMPTIIQNRSKRLSDIEDDGSQATHHNMNDSNFSLVDLDQQYLFKEYFPHNNFDIVIYKANRHREGLAKSQYTFDQNMIKLFAKIKLKFNYQQIVK